MMTDRQHCSWPGRLVGSCLILFAPSVVWADIIFSVPPSKISKISRHLDPEGKLAEREREAQDNAERIRAEHGTSLPQAHLLAAKEIAGQSDAAEQAIEFVFHLQQAAVDPEQASLCHTYLGKIYFSAKQYSQASSHLAKVAQRSADLRYLYARALHASGELQAARRQAEKSLDLLQALLDSGDRPEVAEVYWLDCVQFLERFEAGEQYLVQRLAEGHQSAESQLSKLYRNWSQFLVRRKEYEAAVDKALAAWRFQAEDASRDCLVQSVYALQQLPESRRRSVAADLAEQPLPSQVKLMLGSVLCSIHCWESGIALLRGAADEAPNQPDILNNLAFFLAQAPNGDLEEALEVANELVRVGGSNKMYYETRGQIQCQLENWEQARRDLEMAKSAMPEHLPLHRSLAAVYRELRDPTRSEIHRVLAEKLERQREISKR